MHKKFKTVMAACAIMMSGSLLTGCNYHGKFHGNPEEFAGKIEKHINQSLDKIGASQQQKDEIGQITSQIHEDAQATYAEWKTERGQLITGLFADSPNSEEMKRQLDMQSQAMTEFSHRTLDRLIAMSALLTPEQRKELRQRFESAHSQTKK
jgi:Spy/CpxP family protein refolding chaperone